MPLTAVQSRAKKFLCSNYSIKQGDIDFDGTTLTTAEGNFIPKVVFGGANTRTAVFFPSEVERLMKEPDKNQVVLVPQNGGEIVMMPGRALRDDPQEFHGVRIVQRGPSMATGENGEILLHLSKRTVNSNHYRINHVPMDSMLVYRDYAGHLSVSMVHGHPEFWLALRPENFGV